MNLTLFFVFDPHADYLGLAAGLEQQLAAYLALVMVHVDSMELDAIREHL